MVEVYNIQYIYVSNPPPPLPVTRPVALQVSKFLPLSQDEIQPGEIEGQTAAPLEQQLGSALKKTIFLGIVLEESNLERRKGYA